MRRIGIEVFSFVAVKWSNAGHCMVVLYYSVYNTAEYKRGVGIMISQELLPQPKAMKRQQLDDAIEMNYPRH